MAENNYIIPKLLDDKVEISSLYQNYNSKGNPTSYGIDIFFEEMQLSKKIKTSDPYLIGGKVIDTLRDWEKKYTRYLDNQHKVKQSQSVEELNNQSKKAIEELGQILAHTLTVNDAIDWNSIKRNDTFLIKPENMFKDGQYPDYVLFDDYGKPTAFQEKEFPEEPDFDQIRNRYGLLSKLFQKQSIQDECANEYAEWKRSVEQVKKENITRQKWFNRIVEYYNAKKSSFEEEQKRDNDAIDAMKKRYQEADPKAIEEYCELVLNHSEYPDYFPKNWDLEYRSESQMVVVDYMLPSPVHLPRIESFNYIKARDEIKEKLIPESMIKKIYDNVIYQICIRTIHELFEADVIKALEVVAFNGIVTTINPATGILESKVIISVSAEKEKFMSYDETVK